MKDIDMARLFEALYSPGERPDAETRRKAARAFICSQDGLTLIKHFSPCLQTRVNASSGGALEYIEGRRSIILEIIKLAVGTEFAGANSVPTRKK